MSLDHHLQGTSPPCHPSEVLTVTYLVSEQPLIRRRHTNMQRIGRARSFTVHTVLPATYLSLFLAVPHSGGLPTEDSQGLALVERAHNSRVSLEAVLARGPPKDILGRMLFALAQAPPPFSQLHHQPCPAIPGATRFVTVVQV
jgi:hypothetical protein